MNISSFFAAVLVTVILGFFYVRMIKREVPEPVGKTQAIVPIILGAAMVVPAGFFSIGIMKGLMAMGFDPNALPPVVQSFFSAFFLAGFTEELFKFIVLIIALVIFKKKIINVYEVILIGAAVGFGFSIAEDFYYGEDIKSIFLRLPTLAFHMVNDMIMAEFVAKAMFHKVAGKGSQALNYVLALLVPVAIHSFYDASTILNKVLFSGLDGNTTHLVIGGIMTVVAVIGAIALQIIVLIRFKKKAGEFSAMKVQPEIEEPAES